MWFRTDLAGDVAVGSVEGAPRRFMLDTTPPIAFIHNRINLKPLSIIGVYPGAVRKLGIPPFLIPGLGIPLFRLRTFQLLNGRMWLRLISFMGERTGFVEVFSWSMRMGDSEHWANVASTLTGLTAVRNLHVSAFSVHHISGPGRRSSLRQSKLNFCPNLSNIIMSKRAGSVLKWRVS